MWVFQYVFYEKQRQQNKNNIKKSKNHTKRKDIEKT